MRFALVLALFAACGDGLPGPDAMPPSDAPLGLVRVRTAAEDDQVLFQAADSSLVLVTRTGADGTANAYMPPGGFVTVVAFAGETRLIYTWAGVQPGDELVLRPDEGPVAFSFALSVPVDPGQQGYTLYTPCGAHNVLPAAGSWLDLLLKGCPAHTDMLVQSVGAGRTHYLYAKDVALSLDAMISLPPPYMPIDRSTIEVTNASPGTTLVLGEQSLIGQGARVFDTGQSFAIDVSAGPGTTTFDMPLPHGVTLLTELMPFDASGQQATQHALAWGPSQSTTQIDLAAARVRSVVERPHYDRATHAVRWTEDGTGLVPNVVVAQWSWFRADSPANYIWKLVAPRGEEPVVQLPVLPDELMPHADDQVIDPDGYQFQSLALGGGYDGFRGRLLTSQSGVTVPILGDAGTVSFFELDQQVLPE